MKTSSPHFHNNFAPTAYEPKKEKEIKGNQKGTEDFLKGPWHIMVINSHSHQWLFIFPLRLNHLRSSSLYTLPIVICVFCALCSIRQPHYFNYPAPTKGLRAGLELLSLWLLLTLLGFTSQFLTWNLSLLWVGPVSWTLASYSIWFLISSQRDHLSSSVLTIVTNNHLWASC